MFIQRIVTRTIGGSALLVAGGLVALGTAAPVAAQQITTVAKHSSASAHGNTAAHRAPHVAGVVVAIDGNQITLRNRKGEPITVVTGDDTRYAQLTSDCKRVKAERSDLKIGDRMTARGTWSEDHKSFRASRVGFATPETAKPCGARHHGHHGKAAAAAPGTPAPATQTQ